MSRSLLALFLAALWSVAAVAGAAPLRAGGFVVAPLVMGEPGRPLRGALRDFLERHAGTGMPEPSQTCPANC